MRHWTIPLNEWHNLSKPGKYKVVTELVDPSSDIALVSASFTVTIRDSRPIDIATAVKKAAETFLQVDATSAEAHAAKDRAFEDFAYLGSADAIAVLTRILRDPQFEPRSIELGGYAIKAVMGLRRVGTKDAIAALVDVVKRDPARRSMLSRFTAKQLIEIRKQDSPEIVSLTEKIKDSLSAQEKEDSLTKRAVPQKNR